MATVTLVAIQADRSGTATLTGTRCWSIRRVWCPGPSPGTRRARPRHTDADLASVRAARRFFDSVGHDGRPDIFQLHVDTRPRRPVVRQGSDDPADGEVDPTVG